MIETTETYAERLERRVKNAHDLTYDCQTWEPWEGWERGADGKPVYVKGIGCREHHVCFAR